MVIYLDDYRRARAARVPVRDCRREELMCVNWTPVAGLSATFCYRHPHELSPDLPDNPESIDMEAFLDRAYALASQI